MFSVITIEFSGIKIILYVMTTPYEKDIATFLQTMYSPRILYWMGK